MGWTLGEKMKVEVEEPLIFESDESLPVLDYYPCFGGGLLVSEAAVSFLAQLEIKGQAYRAQLSLAKSEVRDLFAFHLQEKQMCVNRSHSDFDCNPVESEQIERLNKLVIEPSCVKKKPLFRVQEYREWIIATDSFKGSWEKAGFTGCLFEPLEYSWEKN